MAHVVENTLSWELRGVESKSGFVTTISQVRVFIHLCDRDLKNTGLKCYGEIPCLIFSCHEKMSWAVENWHFHPTVSSGAQIRFLFPSVNLSICSSFCGHMVADLPSASCSCSWWQEGDRHQAIWQFQEGRASVNEQPFKVYQMSIFLNACCALLKTCNLLQGSKATITIPKWVWSSETTIKAIGQSLLMLWQFLELTELCGASEEEVILLGQTL